MDLDNRLFCHRRRVLIEQLDSLSASRSLRPRLLQHGPSILPAAGTPWARLQGTRAADVPRIHRPLLPAAPSVPAPHRGRRGAVCFPSQQAGPWTPRPGSRRGEGGGSQEGRRERSLLSQVPPRRDFPTRAWSPCLREGRRPGRDGTGAPGSRQPAPGLRRPLPGAGGRLHRAARVGQPPPPRVLPDPVQSCVGSRGRGPPPALTPRPSVPPAGPSRAGWAAELMSCRCCGAAGDVLRPVGAKGPAGQGQQIHLLSKGLPGAHPPGPVLSPKEQPGVSGETVPGSWLWLPPLGGPEVNLRPVPVKRSLWPVCTPGLHAGVSPPPAPQPPAVLFHEMQPRPGVAISHTPPGPRVSPSRLSRPRKCPAGVSVLRTVCGTSVWPGSRGGRTGVRTCEQPRLHRPGQWGWPSRSGPEVA